MGNLSPSGEAIFRTLIAANYAPFSASFRPSPSGPDFYPKFGQSQAVISSQKGAILETHESPMTSLKFWKNQGQSITIWGWPISNPNLSWEFPISASLRPSSRGPGFYPKFGPSSAAIRSQKKGAISDTHGLPMISLKFWKNHGQSITIWGAHISNPNRG